MTNTKHDKHKGISKSQADILMSVYKKLVLDILMSVYKKLVLESP